MDFEQMSFLSCLALLEQKLCFFFFPYVILPFMFLCYSRLPFSLLYDPYWFISF